MPMPDKYDPGRAEDRARALWEDAGIYRFDPDEDHRPLYSIDTPPPTVSGALHVGHVFSYVQTDCLARFFRMRGYRVFYPMGFDDNGLPTERLVEKEYGIRAFEVPRDRFVEMCRETAAKYERQYEALWRKIGLSVDWSLRYTTNDSRCRRIAQRAFLDLYETGRAYRKVYPTLWCPECRTAVAQAEMEDREMRGAFHTVLFQAGREQLRIATTRPELLAACVALFVHPEDARYAHLIGRRARTPLFDREVPVLADRRADPEKGTGIVMCCTFGDATDVAWWEEYELPTRSVLSEEGTMTQEAGSYAGRTLSEARAAIVRDLHAAGLLLGRTEIAHMVNVHERCGTEIEYRATSQWFIRVLDMKSALLDAGAKIAWHPPSMKIRYDHWVENLRWDWCISRQRYHGIPFPVWYCRTCGASIVAERAQLPVDPAVSHPISPCPCGGRDFTPDPDVMDTWATSSLTPLINARWGEAESRPGMCRIYPMTLRSQAHDIIRTWAFYTIVRGLLHCCGHVPWLHLAISGHALLTRSGRGGPGKISKSKGLRVDPPEKLIEQFSADALRYWACGARSGADVAFSRDELRPGKRLTTKLWNASRFSFAHLKDYSGTRPDSLWTMDRWILSKLARAIHEATSCFEEYDFATAREIVNRFFWTDLCDNYLEIIKGRLYGPEIYGEDARLSAQHGLYFSLLSVLKMMGPFVPYITEEIYQHFFREREDSISLHGSRWPEPPTEWTDPDAEENGDLAVRVIAEVRRRKTEAGVSLKTSVPELRIECSEEDESRLSSVLEDVRTTTRAERVVFRREAGQMEVDLSL